MSDANEWDFTFTWRIENFSLCDPERVVCMTLPDFTIKALENSIWDLFMFGSLGQSEENISCWLRILNRKKGPFVSFKIQIMTDYGEALNGCPEELTFEYSRGNGVTNFMTRRELLEKMKNFRSDTLTVHCSVRRREDGATPLALKGETWTRFSAEKSCIEWRLKFFENLHSAIGRRCFYLGDMVYEMEVKGHQEDEISVRRLWKTSSDAFVVGKMFILDTKGNVIFSLEGSNMLKSEDCTWNFTPFFIKEGLNSIEKERLNEIAKVSEIVFRCEFHLQYEKATGPRAETNSCFSIESILNMTDDLRNLLSSKNYSDVKLKTHNKVSEVHRCVLEARSNFFSAMFDNGNKNETVDVSDVGENVLESFLRFLYTGKVDNLDYEKASKLLLVADKYQVSSLKEECCHFLISNICTESVCSVLELADRVQHRNLKITCMEFIATHVTEVFKTPGWLQMFVENEKVTFEVTLYI